MLIKKFLKENNKNVKLNASEIFLEGGATLDKLLDIIYPIGSIYLSVGQINPSLLLGGTWQQLTGDAYLKLVTSNAGSYNGTSNEHKIPIGSMPSHRHINSTGYSSLRYPINGTYMPVAFGSSSGGSSAAFILNGTASGEANVSEFVSVGTEGNNNSYYPYYYGIYAWVRIS